ncbi:cytosolic Cu/Zn superoxide dismutase, putative [Talaromyces stipitatus ATCC 10500]|uniref:superoxide dismutase n=1 Tax=Talaromyces stipitatus (strain ATCC 10500 / CBS 375.48 / QM 6759 / NRRL 1006) TaxID=441959 RepID=B8LVS6_TALSN|nr:cytosolic Cu/Zn superoxide dismutase, putative [Talaromyces stipitatus ATCC 10500]EED24206.1 cytosolic Cu/Zn superoxide dismutase, putative [Talaromyces stipitatus ATCC 10500]
MIYSLLLLASLALSALVQGYTPAPVTTNNPFPDVYTATLFDSPSSSIRGSITVIAGPGGVGLSFSVHFTGLPPDLGPFPYHIHVLPVPAGGNCTAAGGHLDPYNRGDEPPCDPSDPATCEVGDLSGKHGNATGSVFSTGYIDKYLSTVPSDPAFIGRRSIVVHSSNGARLNCGNFQLISGAQEAVTRGTLGVINETFSAPETFTTKTTTSRSTAIKATTSHPTSTKTTTTFPTRTSTHTTGS